jgi:hypothetical protein
VVPTPAMFSREISISRAVASAKSSTTHGTASTPYVAPRAARSRPSARSGSCPPATCAITRTGQPILVMGTSATCGSRRSSKAFSWTNSRAYNRLKGTCAS